MQLHQSNEQKDLAIDPEAVYRIVTMALDALNVECAELSLQFVTKAQITELHKDFFDDPTPTDCITFPIDPPGPDALLGEVFVCPKTAIEYTSEHGGSPQEETILYICHGILHLIGFDDIDDADRTQMREKEAFLLHVLREQNLIKL